MKRTIIAVALVGIMGIGTIVAQPTGQQVMESVYNRPTASSMEAELTMTLTNSRGAERVRGISQYSATIPEGERKLMFFTAPADVRDTSFMTWSYDDGRDDDQWIYLPALRRVRRISSDSKNDAFMGSDFTYDDLGERHPDEDSHRILREEMFRGEQCFVVESIPRDGESAFSRTITWVVADEWIGLQREYYDDLDRRYKVLEVEEYEQIDGIWVIPRMTMSDESRGSSTTLEMRNIQVNVAIGDIFTERAMQRGVR